MPNQYVIDVSGHNGVVNWLALKNKGVTGGIAKIIRKDLDKDKQFDNNYKALHGLKMPWGVYNYSYATTVTKAKSDMKLVCDILDKCDKTYLRYGVWFDIEDDVQKKLSKAQITDILNAAKEVVESRGYAFGVYTGMSFYNAHIDNRKVKTNNWWIARYYLDKTPFKICQAPNEKYKPTMPQNIIGWQYTSHCKTEGLMTGSSGCCDLNLLYGLPKGPVKKQGETIVNVKIGSARIDEHGKISGGSLGDQNGKEVSTQNWYQHSKGWYVLRAKDPLVAEKLAKAMEWACFNNNIGYDQANRNSLWLNVASKGYRTDKADKCETDCSALVRVCLAYAGIGVKDFNTSTERSVILGTKAFDQMVDLVSKDPAYLKRGDILVTKTKGHTAIVLTNGAKVTITSTTKKGFSGAFPTLPARGYYQRHDGSRTLTNHKAQIKRVQQLVNWITGSRLEVDGFYGAKTEEGVKAAQKILKVVVDGKFGAKTLEAAKAYRK